MNKPLLCITITYCALFLTAFPVCILYAHHHSPDDYNRVELVEPTVDASNSSWDFFSAASRPFGMVNLTPDMEVDGEFKSGYLFNKSFVRFFSHLHGYQTCGVPVMPITGDFTGYRGSDIYGSNISHETEVVSVGYHKVFLEKYGISVELASTKRVGVHRYIYQQADNSYILFDFSTVLGPSNTEEGVMYKVNDREVAGYALMSENEKRIQKFTVYFVAQLNNDIDSFGGWVNNRIIEATDTVQGTNSGGFVRFSTDQDEVVMMKVGISFVSVEQARKNLETEMPHWDFDKVVQETQAEWDDLLGRIAVEGATEQDQRRFYTDLWRTLLGRRIYNDVDGTYIDHTSIWPERKRVPLDKDGLPLFNMYNFESFTGAHWSLNTLWQLVYPEICEEFINSMLQMYKNGGLIPRAPSLGSYTYGSYGSPSTVFIVSSYMKGIRSFDAGLAYEGMVKNHMPGGMMSKAPFEHATYKGGGLEYYLKDGYIPVPFGDETNGLYTDGSGLVLEYAFQDWVLAQFAKSLAKWEDYYSLMSRSHNYDRIWYGDIGSMWLVTPESVWKSPVDILANEEGWLGSNAAQMSWYAPHDVHGLIKLMGGDDSFNERLSNSFSKAAGHHYICSPDGVKKAERKSKRIYLNFADKKNLHTTFLFNYSGAPWLTHEWSRDVVMQLFSGLSPDVGYHQNESQGVMSALSVLMKIGLFETRGGASEMPVYEFGSAIFDKITIKLNRDYYLGDEFVIELKNNSEKNKYIDSAVLNDRPLDTSWVYHHLLTMGGKLTFNMSSKPNKKWAAQLEFSPPSMSYE